MFRAMFSVAQPNTSYPIAHQVADGGIFLPEPAVWLDPRRGKEVAVVSHAHSDHVAEHRRIYCTRATAALMRRRYRSKGEFITLEFGEPVNLGGYRMKLLPAGHILGSAMAHFTRLSDGATLLYTGDFKLHSTPAAEPPAWERADVLIMECTFGQPHYVFPEFTTLREQVRKWCQECLAAGRSPLLQGYSLGKAQEILHLFAEDPPPLVVHPAVSEMCAVYQAMGQRLPEFQILGDPKTLSESELRGKLLVAPPGSCRELQNRLPSLAPALLSGWALHPRAKYQYKVEALFPLSDHADFPSLVKFVELVQPQTVHATHGFAAEFSTHLRRRGWNAWSLQGADQLEFAF